MQTQTKQTMSKMTINDEEKNIIRANRKPAWNKQDFMPGNKAISHEKTIQGAAIARQEDKTFRSLR